MSWSEAELAYLAGIIDGEGTVSIGLRTNQQGNRYHTFILQVSSVDRPLTDWLCSTFGGSVGIHRQSRGNYRALHRWSVRSRQGEAILRAVLPYLLLKRPQAELVLRLRGTVCLGANRLSDEVRAEREAIVAELRRLNWRGKVAA